MAIKYGDSTIQILFHCIHNDAPNNHPFCRLESHCVKQRNLIIMVDSIHRIQCKQSTNYAEKTASEKF